MGTIDDEISTKDAAPEAQTKRSRRILRYDEVYDVQTGKTQLVKTIASDFDKRNKRKAFLLVRRKFDQKGIHTGTEVDIKSSRLAKILEEINFDVEGISLRKNPPLVPLKTFYHSKSALQERLVAARKAEPPDADLINELEEITKFAEDEFADETANVEHLLQAGEITWELLWTIFSPNRLLYRFHSMIEEDQILQLRTVKKITPRDDIPFWDLSCRIVADDGTKFGLANEPFNMFIDEFSGARKIKDLRIYPLDFHPKATEILEHAKQRGRRCTELSEHDIMETSGSCMFQKEILSGARLKAYKFISQGRVIIDPSGFRDANPNLNFMPEVHREVSRDELTEDQYALCTPVAFGFCFSNKKWGGFAMSRLIDVKWNELAFQDLVMEKHKKLVVHSMVKEHSANDDSFDDFIAGKGKGIIGLFSGPPGSGKTLTAEAVAEVTQRPLYSVSAGDLGIEPEKVEENLRKTLEQSASWGAVLLLDEADVFLQKRTLEDIQRNALVSIFLKQLEYYQGILIMTTNQIAQCDPAFASRIHISLEYPALDEPARRQIWTGFLNKLRNTQQNAAVQIGEAEISRLAKLEVNGRQIKNIFNMARIVAKNQGEVLCVSHIELILSVDSTGLKLDQPKLAAVYTNGI